MPSGWTDPVAVGGPGEVCFSVTALIDGTGTSHVAGECGGKIGYAAQAGSVWSTTELPPPPNRLEYDPRLAVQGNVLYLAYTRMVQDEGGCGDSGLRDVGVQVRTRTLPAGDWSEPKLIGEVNDHLHAFRVVNGTIHATVADADGKVYYETSTGASYRRYLIANATGISALRVGDDGKARVAFEANGAIWYGVFSGTGFSTERVDGGTNGYDPVLVLGAGDRPYLLWRRFSSSRGGCIEADNGPLDGTYFSTKVGGAWKTERLSPERGAASLTLDVDTGRVHALVGGQDGLVYLSGPGSGSWSRQTLERVRTGTAEVRFNPANGALLVAYTAYEGGASRVYAMTYE